MPMVLIFGVTGHASVKYEILRSLRTGGGLLVRICVTPFEVLQCNAYTVKTRKLFMPDAQRKKANAKRQAEYRKLHIKDGTDQRLNVILELQAKLALERMAKLRGISNKEMLERVLLADQTQLLAETNEAKEQTRYNRIAKIVDERFEVRNPTLAHLIHTCLDTKYHVLTAQVRAEFAEQVQPGAFNLIEDCCRITDVALK
jgi:hypothetical protein